MSDQQLFADHLKYYIKGRPIISMLIISPPHTHPEQNLLSVLATSLAYNMVWDDGRGLGLCKLVSQTKNFAVGNLEYGVISPLPLTTMLTVVCPVDSCQ